MLVGTQSLPPKQVAPSLVTVRRNAARPRYRAAVVDQPPLVQFVVLSMVLHVLLIVLFGNPTGGARRNEGWFGPLDVTLGTQSPEPSSEFRLAPGLETTSPGAALLPRPGATRPAEAPQRTLERGPTLPAPANALRSLSPSAPEEVDKPLAPAAVSPATVEPVAPPPQPRELTQPAELPPRAVPALPAAPIEKSVAPSGEPQFAPPVELPPRALPAAPAAPLEPTAAPPIERQLAPAAELPPREIPAAPAAPLERLAPAPLEREVVPPVELPARAAPTVPAAPIERLAPAKIAPEIAPPVAVPVPRAEPPALPSSPTALPPTPAAAGPAPRAPNLPSPEEELFRSRREGGTPAPEAPRIDLDAARKKAAREIVSEGAGSRGVFTIPGPPPVERKSKEAAALEKALKPDCRTAYANMGLLAVPVLVASAVAADGSCRW
jgi:hypothetical protein